MFQWTGKSTSRPSGARAAKYKYRSMDEFMDDVRRISENARLYHTQGEKRVAHVPELGVGLVKFMQDEVENALKANPELASPEASVPLPPIPLVYARSKWSGPRRRPGRARRGPATVCLWGRATGKPSRSRALIRPPHRTMCLTEFDDFHK